MFLHDYIKRYSRAPDSIAQEGQELVTYGKPNQVQKQCDGVDFDICPDIVLAAIAAAGAAALLALYAALTMNPNGRRKRRRSLEDYAPQRRSNDLGQVSPMLVFGNEQLEVYSRGLHSAYMEEKFSFHMIMLVGYMPHPLKA